MNEGFVLTPEAEGDVLEIWQFIAEDNLVAADRVVERLFNEFRTLAEMPGKGHFRQDLLDERYRFWPVWSYLIVYRWETKPLQVISVVHGARDLDAFFNRRLA